MATYRLKIANFPYPLSFRAPAQGGPFRIYGKASQILKLESSSQPTVIRETCNMRWADRPSSEQWPTDSFDEQRASQRTSDEVQSQTAGRPDHSQRLWNRLQSHQHAASLNRLTGWNSNFISYADWLNYNLFTLLLPTKKFCMVCLVIMAMSLKDRSTCCSRFCIEFM